MEEQEEYLQLKPEDIDSFIFKVLNKQLDNFSYLQLLEGFIYQFDSEMKPPLDYIAEKDFEFVLLLQNQLSINEVLIEYKILIVNILCNIFSLSPFAAEFFCQNGGIPQLNQLCEKVLQADFDKTNFRRLSDIVLACIGICLEYQPEMSLISLQSNSWIFQLFNIYQKPAQYRSLANYVSLLISNSPQDQSRVITPQISQIFVNLLNFYDPIIYAFILKTLKNIKDKDTLIQLVQQNIIFVLSNYLISIQTQRPRDRSLILQFLFVLSTHQELLPYFTLAQFSADKIMKLTFFYQSSNVVVPRNSNSSQINKKDDDSNSIILLLGIVQNLIKQEFNQEFFTVLCQVAQIQIRNISVIESTLSLLKSLLESNSQSNALHIYNFLKQILLNNVQTKVYLQNNTKFKQSILSIISQLASYDPSNSELQSWYKEISSIQQELPPSEEIVNDEIDNLADILANMDLTENDQNTSKNK
ncbi:hypothetical protein ABPG74_002423 [Tetrahymena malaccensis]